MSDDAFETDTQGSDFSETPQDDGGLQTESDLKKKFAEKWFTKIDRAKKERRSWFLQAKRAENRYVSDDSEYSNDADSQKVWYPLMWSNVQVIRGSIYSTTPIPDVRRRNEQGNPVRNTIATAIERGLEYFIDCHDFDGNLSRSLIDNLVSGMGQVRLAYDAEVEWQDEIEPLTGQPLIDDNTGEVVQSPLIKNQKITLQHVPWKQFIYEPCMNWVECMWVDFVTYLDRREVMKQFDIDPKLEMVGETKKKGGRQKYEVHEVWDKANKRVVFLLRGFERPLKVMKDSMGLKNFFPSPKPLLANCSTKKFEGITDYSYYELQDRQIDRLTRRIQNLTSTATVVRGFYDASLGEELENLSSADDTEYIPVPNLMAKLQMGGQGAGGNMWAKVIADFPIDMVVGVIRVLQEQRESELQHVYQITGISDIMRGSTKASETATAQEIKANAGNSRISVRLGAFNFFCREIFEIAADIASGHFTPETWMGQTGVELSEEMEMVMRDDLLREYAINVETDSTIVGNSAEEKKQSAEAVNVMTMAFQNLVPMISQGMLPADVIVQVIKMAMHPFKQTHALEDAVAQIPNTQQQLQKLNQQVQQGQEQVGQLTQQNQQLMAKVQEFTIREEIREDLKVEAEAEKDFAHAAKLRRDANEPYSAPTSVSG